MKKIFGYMDPSMIMTIVISLIILGVGVYTVFTVAYSLTNTNPYTAPSATTSTVQNQSYYAFYNDTRNNITVTGNQVFNIVGVVLVIGAIMTIVGLVYSYVKPGGGY